MEVSRIGAISPQQIDWRRLTAKEIIKYEQQGVDVPTQYLQWAQEFRATLDTNDDTTYEMAISTDSTETTTTEPTTQPTSVPLEIDNTSTTSMTTEDTSNSTEDTTTPQTIETKTEAQLKREQLENSGVTLREQAKIFTSDSKEKNRAVMDSSVSIASAQIQSVSEIENLENSMNELLAKAEADQTELKNQVSNLNDDKADMSAIGKINKLQKQLERYGVTGQNEIAVTEADFRQFEATINAQSTAILSAQDYGTETIGVGNDLLTSIKGFSLGQIVDYVIAKRAVAAGNDTVGNSESTQTLQTEAGSANSENTSQAVSYKSRVESKTGVAGVSTSNKSNEPTEEDKNKESEKDVQTSQNDGTDTTAKMSTNIDEILKRKIRKGENINA